MKKFAMLLGALTVALTTLTACNTVAGVGKDVQRAGDGIENAAERAKR
ncbi:MAG: entericidin A/B family lipoprotein [Pseudomonadota bacterium]|nr:entericidin A/B family lipoprotein [Pseudomonadota bacterium]